MQLQFNVNPHKITTKQHQRNQQDQPKRQSQKKNRHDNNINRITSQKTIKQDKQKSNLHKTPRLRKNQRQSTKYHQSSSNTIQGNRTPNEITGIPKNYNIILNAGYQLGKPPITPTMKIRNNKIPQVKIEKKPTSSSSNKLRQKKNTNKY